MTPRAPVPVEVRCDGAVVAFKDLASIIRLVAQSIDLSKRHVSDYEDEDQRFSRRGPRGGRTDPGTLAKAFCVVQLARHPAKNPIRVPLREIRVVEPDY